MKTNVGNWDRIFRMVAGLVIIFIGIYYGSWWGLLGLIFLLTAVIRFCPLYYPFSFNTCRREEVK